MHPGIYRRPASKVLGVATSMADIWDDDIEADDESDLVRQLRAVIKAGKKVNDELDNELKTLRPTVRKTKLTDVLSQLGIKNPKIAGLVPADIEPTEDSVKAWVDEYGDVFGVTAGQSAAENSGEQSTDAEGAQTVDDQTAGTWQRIQSQSSQSGVTTPDAESAQIAMLQAAAKAANGSSDLFSAYLNGEREIPTS